MKLNSYVYAPKDDPFHRERWRESYPEDELALLAAKARQLLDAGIADVALLFDDVPPAPVHDEDKARFGQDGAALGDAHAMTIRRFRDAVGPRLAGGDLLVVPMDYAGVETPEYRVAFAAGLPDGVLVWWTGSDIVVGEITRDDLDAAAEVFGDRLLLWDNFPVNDFDRGRAFLGPLLGRTPDAAGSTLHGAWSNPMVEYAPGGFGIAAFADWAWNPDCYLPSRSAQAALRVVAGAQAEALEPLVRTLSSWPPSAPMDTELADLAEQALDDPRPPPARTRLRSRLEEWSALANVDTVEEPARSLTPWMRAAVNMAAAGLAALDLLEGGTDVTGAAAEAALIRAEEHSAKVAVDVVPGFVRAVLKR